MSRIEKRWYFLIDREHLEKHAEIQGIAGILDMLRYDQAVLCSNAPDGFYLLSSPSAPTVARWSSFGIRLAWTSEKSSDHVPYEVRRFADAQAEAKAGTRG